MGFHGFKGRSWAALPGNIHLAAHLAPNAPIERFEVAFTILAAISVVDALEEMEDLEGRAEIKWVNDILLGEKKVAGVLAYTQTQDTTVTSAVLGIGINVESRPQIEATPFVPRITSLREHLPEGAPDQQGPVLLSLLKALEVNYRTLLDQGVEPLLERYRDRSKVLGQEVTLCTEVSDRSLQATAEGRVVHIGDNLELFLEDRPAPVTGGRLILGRVAEELNEWDRDAAEAAPAPAFFREDRS
jgi:BirA family biotin operon repressor/biotin-[acetyl-CoA-carboxylase] ligase